MRQWNSKKVSIHLDAGGATAIPSDNKPNSNIFWCSMLVNKQQGTLYIYAMETLPAKSMNESQQYFIN